MNTSEKKSTKVLVVGISSQRCYELFCRQGENLQISAKLARSFEESVCFLQSKSFDVVWVDAPLFKAGERTWIDEIRDFHGGWLIWSGKRSDFADETNAIQSGVDICLYTSDSPCIRNVSFMMIFQYINQCNSTGKTLSTAAHEIRSRNVSSQSEKRIYQNGRLSVGSTPSEVKIAGHPVNLGWEEFELLRLLIRHQGQMVHQTFLQQWLFGKEGDGAEQNLIKNVNFLRKKLGDNSHAPVWIESVYDAGYRMNRFN